MSPALRTNSTPAGTACGRLGSPVVSPSRSSSLFSRDGFARGSNASGFFFDILPREERARSSLGPCGRLLPAGLRLGRAFSSIGVLCGDEWSYRSKGQRATRTAETRGLATSGRQQVHAQAGKNSREHGWWGTPGSAIAGTGRPAVTTKSIETRALCAAVPTSQQHNVLAGDAQRVHAWTSTAHASELPGHLTALRPSPDESNRQDQRSGGGESRPALGWPCVRHLQVKVWTGESKRTAGVAPGPLHPHTLGLTPSLASWASSSAFTASRTKARTLDWLHAMSRFFSSIRSSVLLLARLTQAVAAHAALIPITVMGGRVECATKCIAF